MSDAQSRPGPAADLADKLAAVGLREAQVLGRAPGESGRPVWQLQHQGRQYALRELDPAVARREAAVHRAAAAGGVPVPAVVAEAPGLLLLAWCPGETLLAVAAAQPERAPELGMEFGRMQARIHSIAAPPGLGAAGPLPGASLIHLDYHPLNVLSDGKRITAVLDWTNARAGDPRADLARTLSILRLEGRDPRRVPAALRAALAPFERGWLAGCGGEVPGAELLAWAGEWMAADLARKRPPEDIARVRRWTEVWHAAAGAAAARDPLALVRQAYAAYGRGDTAAIDRFVHPDLEWTCLDPAEADPQPRVRHGRERLAAAIAAQVKRGLRPEMEEVEGSGERVMVVLHVPGLDSVRAWGSGDDRRYDVVTVRGGRIVALRACRNREEAAARAGIA